MAKKKMMRVRHFDAANYLADTETVAETTNNRLR